MTVLGDDIAAALPELRSQAEALMVDACKVERPNGTTLDPDTLAEVPAFALVWEGPCRVQRSGALSPREQSGAAGYEFGVDSVLAQLPLDALDIKRGHRFTVTAVGDVSDPDLLGLVATVQANMAKTHASKRTLVCEEVTA